MDNLPLCACGHKRWAYIAANTSLFGGTQHYMCAVCSRIGYMLEDFGPLFCYRREELIIDEYSIKWLFIVWKEMMALRKKAERRMVSIPCTPRLPESMAWWLQQPESDWVLLEEGFLPGFAVPEYINETYPCDGVKYFRDPFSVEDDHPLH